MLDRTKVKFIIIHCSDSAWGDVAAIDEWHRARSWNGCGYHRVILNGRRSSANHYTPADDGVIEKGRALDTRGAHCRGHNRESVGICVIGKDSFTSRQLASLHAELLELLDYFNLTPDAVRGHCEFNLGKTCPNMDVQDLRDTLWEMIS